MILLRSLRDFKWKHMDVSKWEKKFFKIPNQIHFIPCEKLHLKKLLWVILNPIKKQYASNSYKNWLGRIKTKNTHTTIWLGLPLPAHFFATLLTLLPSSATSIPRIHQALSVKTFTPAFFLLFHPFHFSSLSITFSERTFLTAWSQTPHYHSVS